MFVNQQGSIRSSTRVWERGRRWDQAMLLLMVPCKSLFQTRVPGICSFEIRRRAVQQTVKSDPGKNRQVYPQGDAKMKTAGPTSEISTQIRQTS